MVDEKCPECGSRFMFRCHVRSCGNRGCRVECCNGKILEEPEGYCGIPTCDGFLTREA